MRKPMMAALVMVSAVSVVVAGCTAKPTTPPVTTPPVTTPASPDAQKPGETTPPAPTTPAPTTPVPAQPEPPKPVKRTLPNPSRGIHLSGWYAGSPDLIGPLMDWCKAAGINTLVLDLKAEDGKLSWNSEIPLAKEIGANERKIGDLPKFIAEAHEKGFWVSGRIVVMNDQYLYRARPSWGIPGFPGGAYSFMDPKNENVWRYNLDIAQAAVKAGVDEIQFDYIRYPEKLVDGYNRDTGADYRVGHIVGFLKKAMEELKPLGVVVGADLFGLTSSVAEGDDMQIGQDYRKVIDVVDYVGLMAYPSHYALGTYGIANPDRAPYETVKASLAKAVERTPGTSLDKHRPWIQDFTYPTAGALKYGPAEVMGQVRALKELGINNFMLWDPSNKYTRGVDYTKVQ